MDQGVHLLVALPLKNTWFFCVSSLNLNFKLELEHYSWTFCFHFSSNCLTSGSDFSRSYLTLGLNFSQWHNILDYNFCRSLNLNFNCDYLTFSLDLKRWRFEALRFSFGRSFRLTFLWHLLSFPLFICWLELLSLLSLWWLCLEAECFLRIYIVINEIFFLMNLFLICWSKAPPPPHAFDLFSTEYWESRELNY